MKRSAMANSRMLNGERLDAKTWWLMVKPHVHAIQAEDGIITVDDSEEKAFTDENELVCWYYDHAKGTTVKGIN